MTRLSSHRNRRIGVRKIAISILFIVCLSYIGVACANVEISRTTIGGVCRAWKYTNGEGIVTKIELFHDPNITDYNNASTVGSFMWAIQQLPYGGAIIVNPGNYTIAQNGVLISNLELIGIGYPKITMTRSTKANIFMGYHNSNIKIHGFEFDGNLTNQTLAPNDDLQCNMVFFGGSNIDIYNNISHGAPYHGLAMYADYSMALSNVSIHDNWFYGNGYRGAHIHGHASYQAKGAIVTNNHIWGNGVLAIPNGTKNSGIFCFFGNMDGSVIANNDIYDEPGNGLDTAGTDGIAPVSTRAVITGNTIVNCMYGIHIGNGIQGAIYSNNVICYSTTSGIIIDGSGATTRDITINGNSIFDSSARGIDITRQCTNLIISNNNIQRVGTGGIYLTSITTGTITNNLINDISGGRGIFYINSKNLFISGNSILGINTHTSNPSIEGSGTCSHIEIMHNILGARGSGNELFGEPTDAVVLGNISNGGQVHVTYGNTLSNTMDLRPHSEMSCAGGDGSGTMPNGLFAGQVKSFRLYGAGGGTWVITLTSGEAGATTLTFDTLSQYAYLFWTGDKWIVIKATCTVS